MAQVGTYNFAVLVDGQVRDQACYGRDLTLDAGVSLAATGGLVCATGGARSAALGAGDYANSAVFSFIADVTPLDATPGVRYVVAHVRSDGTLAKGMLLSDADGFFAVEIDGVRYSSGVDVLDGKHNLCVVYDFDGNLTFYVDGTQVHQTIRSNVNYATGTHFSVGRGATAATGVARAVIGNLRLFNDPVYGEPEVQRFMSSPVEDMLTAAYNFDANTGTVVVDQSIYGNDLALTPNGAWTPGKNGSALSPIANTGAAAIGTGLTLGDYDRLNVSCWVRVDFAGSAAPFLSLEAADGSPRFRLYRGGANGLLMKSWRQDDGTADVYQFGNDGAFITGGPFAHVAVDINPTGWNMLLNGVNYAGGTNGRPPTNDPIIAGLSRLLVAGDVVSGPATIDDLRIIRNYLNPDAVQRLMAQPVTQVPRGTLNRLRVDGVQPNAVRVDDPGDDVLLYVDGDQVYG